MRLLCDENVDQQYVETFRSADWITITTVREVLAADASDETIGRFAEEQAWVVFTGDDDFLKFDPDCGVVLYQQTDRPSPGAVIDALRAIDDAYADHGAIREFVPGGWTRTE